MSTHSAGRDDDDTQRRLRAVTRAAAILGGPLFLLGVLLHPARDGAGVASVGDVYGITHNLEALGLLLQAVSLTSLFALAARRFGPASVPVFIAALVGTLLWFGLIVLDGGLNPVIARYAPDLVHHPERATTTADLNIGATIISLAALLAFPVGYVPLARLLARQERAGWPGLLLGIGAIVYTIGGLAIFALGPESPAIQTLEVAGAVPFALGFVFLGLWAQALPVPHEAR